MNSIYLGNEHARLGHDLLDARDTEDLWRESRLTDLLADGLSESEARSRVEREARDRPWVRRRVSLWDED